MLLVIDTHYFYPTIGFDAVHHTTISYGKADDVCQIILSLTVAVIQPVEPALESPGRTDHNTGIDFSDRPFLSRCLLFLDIADHVPAFTNDAAVTERVLHVDGQYSDFVCTAAV